ncbi:hypothetical protein CesoFtcFv8_015699 [Champsocephalus esox]|uniref:Uncharacterized protein n=1 Tax=Champsocephalus esox TaxID=159716 RepID=A0AAN8BR97_9TELE|nr:hypothetical protein CesoFtcFv8_015699 [Champsocephalus esox]
MRPNSTKQFTCPHRSGTVESPHRTVPPPRRRPVRSHRSPIEETDHQPEPKSVGPGTPLALVHWPIPRPQEPLGPPRTRPHHRPPSPMPAPTRQPRSPPAADAGIVVPCAAPQRRSATPPSFLRRAIPLLTPYVTRASTAAAGPPFCATRHRSVQKLNTETTEAQSFPLVGTSPLWASPLSYPCL